MLIGKRRAWIAGMLAAIVLVNGCAYKHREIYDANASIPVSLPLNKVDAAIVEACISLNWKINRPGPGHIVATEANEKLKAVVDIYFNETSFRIVHQSSEGFGEEAGTIHAHYNEWIRHLESRINADLGQAAMMNIK